MRLTGTEAVWDELPPRRERWRRFRSWGQFLTEATAATASFMLAAAVFSVSVFFALRGSVVVAQQPRDILLYRDRVDGPAAPGDGILWLAMPAAVFNSASQNYGDVVERAYAEVDPTPDGDGPRFSFEGLIEPVYTLNTATTGDECDFNVRCVVLLGAVIIQREPGLLALPGGSARNDVIGFRLDDFDCSGARETCRRFERYSGAVAALRATPNLQFKVTLEFHSDGKTELTCRVDEAAHGGRDNIFRYLERTGWANLNCLQS